VVFDFDEAINRRAVLTLKFHQIVLCVDGMNVFAAALSEYRKNRT